MAGGRVRKVLVVAGLGALVALVVRALRGEPAPQFSTHPSVNGGPAPAPVRTPEPETAAEPEPEPETAAEPEPEPELTTGELPVAELATPEAELELASTTAAPHAAAGEVAWVAPVDGACPEGYPIKAKLSSGIYHRPGGLAYERTKPDRCYPTAEAAEADGLRPPKR